MKPKPSGGLRLRQTKDQTSKEMNDVDLRMTAICSLVALLFSVGFLSFMSIICISFQRNLMRRILAIGIETPNLS